MASDNFTNHCAELTKEQLQNDEWVRLCCQEEKCAVADAEFIKKSTVKLHVGQR